MKEKETAGGAKRYESEGPVNPWYRVVAPLKYTATPYVRSVAVIDYRFHLHDGQPKPGLSIILKMEKIKLGQTLWGGGGIAYIGG